MPSLMVKKLWVVLIVVYVLCDVCSSCFFLNQIILALSLLRMPLSHGTMRAIMSNIVACAPWLMLLTTVVGELKG